MQLQWSRGAVGVRGGVRSPYRSPNPDRALLGRAPPSAMVRISVPSTGRNRQEGMVLARWEFWITTLVSLLVAIIAGYTMMLFGQNRLTQTELERRNQYVQVSIQRGVLYRELAKALADLSIRNQDKALGELLASHGISVNVNAGSTPAITPPVGDPKAVAKP